MGDHHEIRSSHLFPLLTVITTHTRDTPVYIYTHIVHVCVHYWALKFLKQNLQIANTDWQNELFTLALSCE